MPNRRIRVTASSRLHFGLIAIGESVERQFGGVGVMVEPPHTCLMISPADRFQAEGTASDRVIEFVNRWRNSWSWPDQPACCVLVESLPRMHSGLGVGTQLALSIAAGLNAYFRLEPQSPTMLATSVGRGQRSAVGSYGFFEGGLIAERGKTQHEPLAPLYQRVALPADWRFVLICPADNQGLHGEVEKRAFGTLPPVPAEVLQSLTREIDEHILPAAQAGDFSKFSEGVYRFGYQSGLSFAAVQRGPYNGPRLTGLVQRVQSLGYRGVGQSSWGATLYVVCENLTSAQSLVSSLRDEAELGTDISIAAPCNHGAVVDSL